MRYYFKVIVALAVIGGGLGSISSGFSMITSGAGGGEVFGIGAMLILFGVLVLFGMMIYVGIKRARNMPAGTDPTNRSETAFGMHMTDDFSNEIGNFDDFGDSGGDSSD